MSNRAQKRELERELKKAVKARKVSVIQLEDGTYRYAFRFYSWTERGFKTYITKRGHHWNANEDGKETRMWEAWNDAGITGKMHLPILLEDQDIILVCPIELNAKQANKFSSEVDEEVKRLAAPYNVRHLLKGMKGAKNLGTEAYDIADNVWQELVQKAYNTICEKYKVTPKENNIARYEAQGEVQEEVLLAIESYMKSDETKGILDLPPATGKTVIFALSLQMGLENGTINQKGVSILAAPFQPLCNKNLVECEKVVKANNMDVVQLEYHSGSHDNNRKSFLTADQEKSREKLYADEINYHLNRDKHVVIHVCFDSYVRLQRSLILANVPIIEQVNIDEFHLQCTDTATERNAMIRHIVNNQIIPIKKQIAMTGTIVEHDLNSTYESGRSNYSASNSNYWGSYIKRVTYGETVLQGLNLPFNVVGVNALGNNLTNRYGSIKLDEVDATIGFNLANSIVTNTMVCKKNHNVVLSIFNRNEEARMVADKMKESQKTDDQLKEYKIVCLTTVLESSPSKRNAILRDINKDKENKYLILTGPWVITGSNCPRIDGIVWNFCPQSYVNIVQGTLRAARVLRLEDHSIDTSKEKFTAYFILTDDVVKNNTFASSLEKLHKTQYSSDIKLFTALGGQNFFSIEDIEDQPENTNGDIHDEIIEDLPNVSPEELEEIKEVLNIRLNDLLNIANTEDYSASWSFSQALNKISKPRLMGLRADFYINNKINEIESYGRDVFKLHDKRRYQSNEFYIKEFAEQYQISLEESAVLLEDPIKKIETHRNEYIKNSLPSFFMSK